MVLEGSTSGVIGPENVWSASYLYQRNHIASNYMSMDLRVCIVITLNYVASHQQLHYIELRCVALRCFAVYHIK